MRQTFLLIDRNIYHAFVPLLYQVATSFIAPKTVAYPIKKYLHTCSNARFLQAEVLAIDFAGKVIETATIIWKAGVEANLPTDTDKLATAK